GHLSLVNPSSQSESEGAKYSLYRSYPIKILRDKFSGKNGPITNFTIILLKAGDSSNVIPGGYTKDIHPNNPSYTVVYNNEIIPPFFVFGEYDACKPDSKVCNKYLEEDTSYNYQFLVISEDKCTPSEEFPFKTKVNIGRVALTASVATIVAIFVCLIALLFLYKRFFSPIIKRGESLELPLIISTPKEESLHKPIRLSELKATVSRLLDNGRSLLTQEFRELKFVSPSKPCDEANNGYNSNKNRYLNILP
ncbi:hypothetical protein SK128_009575, partial [Halocaridina rubra]